jgi:hypothetical protein
LTLASPGGAAGQQRTHALIVVGLGGTAEYREQFHDQATRLRTALLERHGLRGEDVTYLGERVEMAPDIIADRATRANVMSTLGEIAQRAASDDRLLVVLIGHGTAGRDGTSFNLSGPDLAPADFVEGLGAFPTQQLALVHTGSGSGGFVAPLSGPNRIVIAATRTERELNATEFGDFFIDALSGEGADLDKDQRISLLEAFSYARQEVERFYQNENELLTEHAVLDDNGDGQGSQEVSATGADGRLAAGFRLGGVATVRAAEEAPTDDPVLQRLYTERTEIQGRIDGLRAVRDSMSEDDYLARMEELLVELALKNREIRERGGE